MPAISLSDLAKIPHIECGNLQGRTIATLTFFVDGEWQLWLPTEKGLLCLKGQPAEGFYFARQPELPTDVYLHFLDFIAQRGCWPSVVRSLRGLMEDFFNLGACIKKFDILFEHSQGKGTSASRLVATELEYLFGLCRSVFDLLQEVIALQWENVHLLDQSIKKKQLPKTFSSMVLNTEILRAHDELVKRFHIPSQLAAFYVRAGPFFQVLRTFRDRFFHGGTTLDRIYTTERGFAVPSNTAPFCDFKVWNEAHMLPNQLCSLRPAIAHIVTETLRACEDYAATVQSVIQYPPPVSPGFQFCMRGYFNDSLHDNKRVLEECLWWNA